MKVRIGNSHRSYTPMFVDRESGKTQFLIHLHGNGQGANWARNLKIGEEAHLTDPKASLKLPPKESEVVFFGDETTFGAACAVQSFCRNSRQLFEVASLEEGGKVLLHRNFSTAQLTLKEEGDAHLEKIAKQIIEMAASCRDPQVVLMGKKQSILKVAELLRSQNFPSENCRSKDHWSHKPK
jgi:NADPH-dependent ferric siderophore reductase